jgi:predicted peptidase
MLTRCFNEAQGIESSERKIVEGELAQQVSQKGGYAVQRKHARATNLQVFVDRTVSLDQEEYHYQVYVPTNYTKNEKWPVILFLHGKSRSGKDGIGQTLRGMGPAIRKNPEQYPCLVVMPQCRENHSWGDPKMETMVFAALEQTLKEFNVDADRMYLTGLSSGANATWYFAARYPGKFAAVVPMAGASPLVDLSDEQYAAIAASFTQTAVWVFHGEADDIIDVAEPRKLVEILRQAKANVRYTEYEGVGHASWVLAYDEPDLIPWLLSQRRAT